MQGSSFASVPDVGSGVAVSGVAPFDLFSSQSRLPTWSSRACYRGDDLPGVPLDCFTADMIDDGSDPSYVPYEHRGLDSDAYCSESLMADASGDEMEVDED